jgi:hypothetical protein
VSNRRKPEVDAAFAIIESGTATSFQDAADKAGCSVSAVYERWRAEGSGPPPFKSSSSSFDDIVARALAETEDVDEEHEPTPAERELARRVLDANNSRKRATTEARVAKTALETRDTRIEELEDALELALETQSVEAPEWLSPTDVGGSYRATLVAAFSDFHVGEVVEPTEVADYNAYDPDIAKQRIERFFERTVTVSRRFLAGVDYDGIVMPNLGDTISGDIHEEFQQTNELSNFEAVPFVVPLIEAGIGLLADEFGKVHVPCVPGNHPRDSRKPRYKKRSAHNADTMISKLVASKFKNDDRVTFDIPDGISADFEVYGTKFRIEHGDEAKGGSGIQGAMLPIALMAHRRRKQAQVEGRPFDCLLIGHWHQYLSAVGKGFVVNGAGKGYDEYARGKGFEPEPPQQALMVVTPEHGVTTQCPLFVSSRSAEGW